MQVWKGWIVATDPIEKAAFTWDQWCAYQAQRQSRERRQQEGTLFTERELARLSFARWLYQTGRLDPVQRQHLSAKQQQLDTTARRKSA